MDAIRDSIAPEIQIKPVTPQQGEPAIQFSEVEEQSIATPFKLSLVGKFSFRRPKMLVIHQVFLLDPRHVLLKLELDEDFSQIWVRQTWYISGRTMRIFKWTANFWCSEESPIVPVWISLLFFIVHYIRCKQALCSIAGAISKPLRVDHAIVVVINPSIARVLIEFDVSKPPIPRIWIGAGKPNFWKEVIFERLLAYCTTCKHIGHSDRECFVANPPLRKTQRPSHEIQTTTNNDPTPMRERENPSIISPPSVKTRGAQNDVAMRDPTILDGDADRCTGDITPLGSGVQRVYVGSRFYRSMMITLVIWWWASTPTLQALVIFDTGLDFISQILMLILMRLSEIAIL